MQPGGLSSEAMREHLVEEGFDPAVAAEALELWQSRLRLTGADDPFRFRRDLGLSDDPKAMSPGQLDRLIGYHDSLCERFDQALARLDDVSDQIQAAMREHRTQLAGDLRGSDAAPLLEAWNEAFAECDRYHREIEAVASYAEPLLEDEPGDESSFPAP
jgi:hypothetical protein